MTESTDKYYKLAGQVSVINNRYAPYRRGGANDVPAGARHMATVAIANVTNHVSGDLQVRTTGEVMFVRDLIIATVMIQKPVPKIIASTYDLRAMLVTQLDLAVARGQLTSEACRDIVIALTPEAEPIPSPQLIASSPPLPEKVPAPLPVVPKIIAPAVVADTEVPADTEVVDDGTD